MKQPDMHSAKRFIRPITYGILFGGLACFILLILMSALMGFHDIPQAVISLFATISFVFGGLVAGYISASCARERGMFLGLCCGGCLFLVLLCAGFMMEGNMFGVQGLTKLASVLMAAALGGIFGVNRRKKFR